MGEAILCARAPGTKNAADGYALVCVRYPAMSDCRCEKEGKSLTVRSGSGATAFAVDGSGTWTVTISNGAHSKSGSVSVAAAGEVKSLVLSYSADPVEGESALLSASGGLAGGYSLGGNAAMSGRAIRESGTGGFWITPAVDLSGYTRLTVSGVLRSAQNTESIIRVGSTTGKVFELIQQPERAALWNAFTDLEGCVTLDISALNGTYYIGSAQVGNNLELTGIVLS